ncbi:hypothetical protein [Conexibacter sp. SYSU D00693]|uniref:hypothetical protein n=1 Tax=Conexibacter sp. SYSU D00693 TaxID=2812560 RepID=UPI00196B2030|nr:hypothetical protein [Conexibacter sp. SYSU D00693]
MDESPRTDPEPGPGDSAGVNEGEMAPDRPTDDSEDTAGAAQQEEAAEQSQRSATG